ncbi:hypothetical protein ACFQS1_27760 [Paractinoplanes rhizophilus]|uniref:Uncharacterized protein n=1 Tax=Paractinoplanes rhizophilus TaxID=1416877 RepID=A0ABW2I030_9ACTN
MPSTGNGRFPARRGGPDRRTAHIGLRRAAASPDLASDDRRGWNELLSSGLVILAGVIVVIGFGIVASRVMRSADGNPLPDPPPTAALGGAALPSTGPGGLIPLEPASPSPTSSSPSPSPSLPPSTPPTRKPVDQGAIAVATGGAPSAVDLTAEGKRDWVHWGEDGTFSLERDKNGGFAILEGTPAAPRFRHALSPSRFSWTGGDPVDHSDGTPTGIRTCGAGNGFTLSAPASTARQTLRLYLGVVSAKGVLHARLSAGGATSSATVEQRDGQFRGVVYTITYRAPRAAKIDLTWTTARAFGDGCGGVALEAATLF